MTQTFMLATVALALAPTSYCPNVCGDPLTMATVKRARSTRLFTSDRAHAAFAREDDGFEYYGGAVIGAASIGRLALDRDLRAEIFDLLGRLEHDDYVEYVARFAAAGEARAGPLWQYADLTTVLAAACRLIDPRDYLEIGVRTGRSLAVAAHFAPQCELLGVDLWEQGYADMPNPGPAFVERQLELAGAGRRATLLSGDSHDLLPKLFRDQPALAFDIVTVDGDHSTRGAKMDLEAVLPSVRIGGCVLFDDIAHPAHPGLARLWRDMTHNSRWSTWEFDDVGYGVAVAVRRW